MTLPCKLFTPRFSLPKANANSVNEIFNPDRVDSIYNQDPHERQASLQADRATNYGVVRINLLEDIYYRLYLQRVTQPDEKKWRVRILPNRCVISATNSADGKGLDLKLAPTNEAWASGGTPQNVEEIKATMVFFATGYVRNAHEEILSGTKHLLSGRCEGKFTVARNYRVQYDTSKVDGSAGVWLQGCNEKTHGVSAFYSIDT
jgi:L-ornithine N5-oxygenase